MKLNIVILLIVEGESSIVVRTFPNNQKNLKKKTEFDKIDFLILVVS